MATSIPRGQVFTGARARFMVNNKTVGYATSVSGSESIMYEPIEVLDNIQVAEHVPLGYYVSFSASRVRLFGANAGTAGSLKGELAAFPKLGADSDALLANILDLADDMTCVISDAAGRRGENFMTLKNVKITSHNWAIAARGVVGEDISFVAIRMHDEEDPA